MCYKQNELNYDEGTINDLIIKSVFHQYIVKMMELQVQETNPTPTFCLHPNLYL